MAALLKKGTAQSIKLANLARIFINLSWYDITDGIYQSVTCVTLRRFTILQMEYIRASRALLCEGLRYYRRNISERHVRYSAKVYDITDGIYQSVTCVTLRRFTILQTEYIRASRALLYEGLRYY